MKDDNDNGRQFHITLNPVERRAINYLRTKGGSETSLSAVIRACIHRTASEAGFDSTSTEGD